VSCCQDAKPPLTGERKTIIKAYLKKQRIHVAKPFAKAGYSYPAVDAETYCIFYSKRTKKCLVHEVKPETCVAGPVTFDINLRTGNVEWFLKTGELCIFAEKLYLNKEKFNEHFKIAKEKVLRLICKLDAEALLAILKVEERQTFKIGEEPLSKEAADKLKPT
jgi:Fe-S-cluster containining protein